MRKKMLILLSACLLTTACSPKMSGEKIESKDISEYEPSETTEDTEYAALGEIAPDIVVTDLEGVIRIFRKAYDNGFLGNMVRIL